MKLTISTKAIEPVEAPIAAVRPYVAAKHTDPDYDPLLMWTIREAPAASGEGRWTIPDVAKERLAHVIETVVSAGIEALEVIRIDKNTWKINYYD